MTGATAKSKPKDTKLDEKELSRLQKQDYWLQITRAKLVMDLIFVCRFSPWLRVFDLEAVNLIPAQHTTYSGFSAPKNR